ncbi:hypothetical protein ENBRE01_3458, partial [Enteropsectra breve]
RSKNISVCCAMNSIAIAHYKVLQVAYNTETFIVFLEELFAFF